MSISRDQFVGALHIPMDEASKEWLWQAKRLKWRADGCFTLNREGQQWNCMAFTKSGEYMYAADSAPFLRGLPDAERMPLTSWLVVQVWDGLFEGLAQLGQDVAYTQVDPNRKHVLRIMSNLVGRPPELDQEGHYRLTISRAEWEQAKQTLYKGRV